MAATERTPLTRPTDPPTYVEFAGLLRARRTKLRQFQCCVCAFLLAVFIMALVVTISYSINQMDSIPGDSPEVEDPPSLKSTWTSEFSADPLSGGSNNGNYPTSLTNEEWNEAMKAGQAAITSRKAADALATPLPAPSPNSRHQYAVKTSLQAGKLALGGIGELAATRSVEQSRAKLGASSSIGSYFKNIWIPEGSCKEFLSTKCPPSKYRNFDGTCNNPKNFGAALSPFLRKLEPAYADGIDAPRTGKFGKALPSAREISLKVHPPAPSANPSFTVMLAVFGQFLDHDITATAISQGTNGSSLSCCPALTHLHPECFPVEVGPGDPVYDVAGRNCMEFVRSAPAPQCKIGPREQLNQVTAFIDASVIYGPDLETAKSLREGQGGTLRMFKTPDNRTLLPQSTDPNDGCNRQVESTRGRYCFASGDGRANENLHLTTMHLLWARQHNKLAAALSELNPNWGDEEIYQEARRIVGAQLQNIAYKEFVPIVLGEKEVIKRNLRPLNSGFRSRIDCDDVNPAIANSFAAAAFRFAHTLLPGLMKVTDRMKETSSYVELHRMLFNPYSLYSKGGMESSLTSTTSNLIQKTTTHVTSQLTKHLFEDPLANATIPCGLDLVSLNIQRGRDHGLPGYNAWRQFCGLGKVTSFAELAGELEPDSLNEISKVYEHVDDVDLYTGALAESDKDDGLVGPTFRCIIGDQFSRIQRGDRFWYEVPGEPQSFTAAQLQEIRKTSLAKMICDCSDGIKEIQPEVMRSISSENPMTSCEDISGLDLIAWKDANSAPVLQAALKIAPEVPEGWIKLKTEINKTVEEIVGFFGKSVPVSESTDWTSFKNWINQSFTEIRNELSALHPQPSLENKDKETSSQSVDLPSVKVENKNDLQLLLTGLKEYSETAATLPTIHNDWLTFKSNINKTLNDALVKVTGKPTAEQREELKKQIEAQVQEMKDRISSLQTTRLALSFVDPAAKAEWFKFKNDLVKSVTAAVDRMKAKAPLPGDPAWATFGSEMKKQFASVKDSIPVKPSLKLSTKDPSAAAYWDNFRNSLNKSLDDALAGVTGKMPPTGDPAWAAFGAKIKNDFSGFKDKFADVPKPMEKASAEGTVLPFDWIAFKNEITKSINETVDEINKNKPPPGSPAWATFRDEIMKGFGKIATEPSVGQLKSSAESSDKDLKAKTRGKMESYNWMSLKNEISKSTSDMLEENNLTSKPRLETSADSSKWAAKLAKFNGTVQSLKSTIDSLRPKPEAAQFSILAKDWMEFKKTINASIAKAVESTKSQATASGFIEPEWSSFKDSIKTEFDALKNEIANAKAKIPSSTTTTVASSISNEEFASNTPQLRDELVSILTKANSTILQLKKSIADTKPGAIASVVSPADWIEFKRSLNDSIAKFVNSRDAAAAQEWDKMKTFANKSFADLRSRVAALINSQIVVDDLGEGKKAINLSKSGKSIASNETDFDWKKLKTDIATTVQNLLDDVAKIKPDKTPEKSLKSALQKARSDFEKLPNLTSFSGAEMPSIWTVFVSETNKTMNGLLKKIAALKPANESDSIALENYEKQVDSLFNEIQKVVEIKKKEFAGAMNSMASSSLQFSINRSSQIVAAATILHFWTFFHF